MLFWLWVALRVCAGVQGSMPPSPHIGSNWQWPYARWPTWETCACSSGMIGASCPSPGALQRVAQKLSVTKYTHPGPVTWLNTDGESSSFHSSATLDGFRAQGGRGHGLGHTEARSRRSSRVSRARAGKESCSAHGGRFY